MPALLAAARRAARARSSRAASRRSCSSRGGASRPFLLCRDCGHDFRCSQLQRRADRARPRTAPRLPLLRRARAAARALPRVRRRAARGDRRRHRAGRRPVRRDLSRTCRASSSTGTRRGAAARRPSSRTSSRAGRRCLIGTQMVAKGHDFPGRHRRRASSRPTRCCTSRTSARRRRRSSSSRRSRGAPGAAIRPAPSTSRRFTRAPRDLLAAAARRGRPSPRQELEFRRAFFYPPFCELAAILVSSPDRERAEAAAREHRTQRFRGGAGTSCGSRARRRLRSSGSRGAGASRSSCAPPTGGRSSRPSRPPSPSGPRPARRSRWTSIRRTCCSRG